MLGTWSMAASMPARDGSAAPRMSFTFRARLPRGSSAIAWSSATIDPQSSCALLDEPGGVVAATDGCGGGPTGWYGAAGAIVGTVCSAGGVAIAGNCCVG